MSLNNVAIKKIKRQCKGKNSLLNKAIECSIGLLYEFHITKVFTTCKLALMNK